MAVYIKPCRACPKRTNCTLREKVLASLSSKGLRSAVYNCDDIDREIRPGRRVIISVLAGVRGPDYYGENHNRYADVKATVVRGDAYKGISCVIDPGEISERPEDHSEIVQIEKVRFRKTMNLARVKALLDEPDLPICDFGYVIRNGQCDRPENERGQYCCLRDGFVGDFPDKKIL